GAEQVHPISPLTTTFTYGPIDPATGRIVVKLIYDHRVLDGAYIARRLQDIEDTLNGPILDELRRGQPTPDPDRSTGVPPNLQPRSRSGPPARQRRCRSATASWPTNPRDGTGKRDVPRAT